VTFLRGAASAAAVVLASSVAPAKAPPLPPLPMLPSIARVRVAKVGDALLVVTDVSLPRGDWSGDALRFHVAFGAPGIPRAIDAHLLPVADGALEADEDLAGDALAIDRVPRRPDTAYPLLGREQMAGIVVHVPAPLFKKALEPGNLAALRIRTALDAGEADASGAHGVVVRLGVSRGTPLTLGRVTVGGKKVLAPSRAEAKLCGPDADPHPLAVGLVPRPAIIAAPAEPPIAPVLAVRHATDDLCVRFWSQ
jgi:hypothetical protein